MAMDNDWKQLSQTRFSIDGYAEGRLCAKVLPNLVGAL